MMTIVINDIDDNMVERFKVFAKKQGVGIHVYQQDVPNTLLEELYGKAEPETFTEALMSIPRSHDNEDIFARNYQQYNPNREIDWSE